MKLSVNDLHDKHKLSYRQIDMSCGTQNLGFYKKETIKSLRFVSELMFVLNQFRQSDIEIIPLKGPLLSAHIYGDETLRRCIDLDFLIKQDNIGRVYKLFSDLGYCSNLKSGHISTMTRKYSQKQIRFWHPEKKIMLEFHWKLFSFGVFGRFDTFEVIAPFCQYEMISGISVLTMKKEFEILYVTIHGALHKWSAIRWLLDTSDYLKKSSPDVQKIMILSKEYSLNSILCLYNDIAKKYLESPVFFQVAPKSSSPYLISACEKVIENPLIINMNVFKRIGETCAKFRYQYLLFPGCKRRINFVIHFFLRYFRPAKMKSLIIADYEKR